MHNILGTYDVGTVESRCSSDRGRGERRNISLFARPASWSAPRVPLLRQARPTCHPDLASAPSLGKRGGALPALKVLNLEGNTAASQQARDAVQAALAARSH